MKVSKLPHVIALVAFLALGWSLPSNPAPVILDWDYAVADATNIDSFNIYGTTNLGLNITNWTMLTNVSSALTNAVLITNGLATYRMVIQLKPDAYFFTATASNFWGESVFSNTATTPPSPMATNTSLRIRRQ